MEEVSERKLQQWKNRDNDLQKANYDVFIHKANYQRRETRYLKENSLWIKSFDKCVDLMARVVFVVHIRICFLFRPRNNFSIEEKVFPHSGPLLTAAKPVKVWFYSRNLGVFFDDDEELREQTGFFTRLTTGNAVADGAELREDKV